MSLKGDQSTTRAMNRRLILNLLRSNGPMSRAEIATTIGLSPATVTFVVADLIAENLLLEGKSSPGTSGRRPIPIELNYAGQLAVGLKLMVGSIDCVLTDLSTTPIASLTITLADQSPESVVRGCEEAVRRLVELGGNPGAPITGIGIAMPGVIEDGVCRKSHRFGWDNVPIAAMLAERVHVPVWVDDDTNAFALAQMLFGLGRHHRTVGALAIGAGISCAVIVEASVHRGAHGAAGKMGHSTFDPSGPICECGRPGCLQTFFSEPALVRRWRERADRPADVTRYDMLASAQAGDETAIALLREAGEGIGRHLAEFCNLIDPEVIVVGGEAVAFGDFLFDPMRTALKQNMMWSPPPITPDWTDNSWARGAAALATQKLFDFEAISGAVRVA